MHFVLTVLVTVVRWYGAFNRTRRLLDLRNQITRKAPGKLRSPRSLSDRIFAGPENTKTQNANPSLSRITKLFSEYRSRTQPCCRSGAGLVVAQTIRRTQVESNNPIRIYTANDIRLRPIILSYLPIREKRRATLPSPYYDVTISFFAAREILSETIKMERVILVSIIIKGRKEEI